MATVGVEGLTLSRPLTLMRAELSVCWWCVYSLSSRLRLQCESKKSPLPKGSWHLSFFSQTVENF